jgi:hypothetical protein
LIEKSHFVSTELRAPPPCVGSTENKPPSICHPSGTRTVKARCLGSHWRRKTMVITQGPLGQATAIRALAGEASWAASPETKPRNMGSGSNKGSGMACAEIDRAKVHRAAAIRQICASGLFHRDFRSGCEQPEDIPAAPTSKDGFLAELNRFVIPDP